MTKSSYCQIKWINRRPVYICKRRTSPVRVRLGWCIKRQEFDFPYVNLVNNQDLHKPVKYKFILFCPSTRTWISSQRLMGFMVGVPLCKHFQSSHLLYFYRKTSQRYKSLKSLLWQAINPHRIERSVGRHNHAAKIACTFRRFSTRALKLQEQILACV